MLELINLNNAQRRQFREALMSAYRNETGLAMLLADELDVRLNEIVGGETYTEIVFNLINWAEARGELAALIQAAYRQNPANSDLCRFMESIGAVETDQSTQLSTPSVVNQTARPSTPLTASQRRRLQQRQDALQPEVELRSEKLKHLRQNLAIETSAAVKFQLQKQIEAEETQLTNLITELETIESSLQGNSSPTQNTFNSSSTSIPHSGSSSSIPQNEVTSKSNTFPEQKSSQKVILFLAAQPIATTRLRLDEEIREIEAGLQRSQHRDRFKLEQRWAVRPRDLRRAMLDCQPQILHFSGHGVGRSTVAAQSTNATRQAVPVGQQTFEEGLILEDQTGQSKLVNTEALAALFKLFADSLECVVLNACYSERQAQAIAEHIPYVIGMNQAVGDRAAIEFAISFYDALGAGRSIEFAFELACTAISLAGIPENLTPVMKRK